MLIVIPEEEKIAIQDYFNHPERYMGYEIYASLPGGLLPNGTKVSRAKFEPDEGHIPRQYIIPAGMDGEARSIPITTIFSGDPRTHSATMLNEKIYFHQNKDDLPKKLPANFDDYCEMSEDIDPEDKSYVAYKKARERVLGKPDYIFSFSDLARLKKTVKYAVDIEGNTYYLKSLSSIIAGGVPLPNRIEQYAPQLYMGPSIFRQTFFYRGALTKRVDITRDSGKNLDEFLFIHRNNFSIEKELLAREVLKQYLVQINEKGLVHTDIKPANICVKIGCLPGRPFEVIFIDWDDAFSIEAPGKGSGTPGYMAPEFFKTLGNFERQLENRAVDNTTYTNTLKVDYKNLFSELSDIYALGIVLLNDLLLERSSGLYHLAISMCQIDPSNRPSVESMREALELRAETTSQAIPDACSLMSRLSLGPTK